MERHEKFYTPNDDVRARIAGLQAEIDRLGAAIAWIDHNTDLLYYTGSIQDAVLLVPAHDPPSFYVRASLERAAAESPLEARPFPGTKVLIERAGTMLKGGALAISLDVTPASFYLKLIQGLGDTKVVDMAQGIRKQRAIKSKWEIEQIDAATRQAGAAFDRIPSLIRPGLSEIEVSAQVEAELRRMSHGGPLRLRRMGQELAMIMFVSGASGRFPTNFDGPVGGEGPYHSVAMGAGRKVLKVGETVMADMVTLYNGYHSDNARTFFLGSEPTAEILESHEFCLEALARLEAAIRPGRPCSEVFHEVDSWARERGEPEGFMGFEKNRVKFFGHGVGLELDELPVIADRVDIELQPGMIIAVEPKAFLKRGPVGVENTYVVTDSGCRSLCNNPRDIIAI